MNTVDFIVIGVVAVSALIAFLRGFVREMLTIGSGLGDTEAARHVEIDVAARERQAAARLEHGQHHGQARRIPAHHGAAGRTARGRRHQRL